MNKILKNFNFIKNNDKALILKLYDNNNNELDLSSFTYKSIKLIGKINNETQDTDIDLEKEGVLYTDDNGDKWIKFQFTLADYETILLDKYICEIIVEKETDRYFNAFIEGSKEHRFQITFKDSYIN